MPKRLGNWEVPRWAPTRARPLEMRPNPKPISDINGHFLPGAPRGTSRCFGHYTGTWELPRKITKEVAQQLAREPPEGRFPDWLNLRVQRPKISARMRSDQRKKTKKPKEDEQSFKQNLCPCHYKRKKVTETRPLPDSREQENQQETENEESHDNNNPETQEDNKNLNDNFQDQLGLLEKREPVDEDGHGPYVPGTLTDLDKRHDSYDLLNKQAIEQVHGPQEDETEKFWRKVDENAKSNEQSYDENMKYNKKSKTPKLPAVTACQNFQFARKMHVGNLEHQPLPDTLGYRNLNKIAEHRDSDIIVKPYAIGWKGYGASGPTCCTKMRVHRPKTCDLKKTDTIKDGKHRPSTSGPDLGGQYKKSMSLMDLAICWDFRPNNSKQEPKPPKHIDGSNGSKAPAVFTMVHTPKDEVEELFVSGHSNPIFNQNRYTEDVGHHPVPYFEKDMTKEKRKDSCEVQYCPQHADGNAKSSRSGSTRRNSAQSNGNKCDGIHGCDTPSETSRKSSPNSTRPDKLQPIKDAWAKDNKTKDARSRHSLESYEKTPLAQGKLHQSSPNESLNDRRSTKDSDTSNNNVKHKQCISCNGTKIPQDVKQKEDYKFAFKAGNPNSVQSISSTDSKEVKVPKMRHPYTKKSYTIPTLAPPFSIWRDANATGYPEHWRLASVYQHAYKPPEQRRKPLLASVYQ